MTATWLGTLLAICCAGIEGMAQVALKQSTRQRSRRSRWIALGVALFAVEAVLYTAALQRLDVSVAYALGALSYVSVALLSALLLREIGARLAATRHRLHRRRVQPAGAARLRRRQDHSTMSSCDPSGLGDRTRRA